MDSKCPDCGEKMIPNGVIKFRQIDVKDANWTMIGVPGASTKIHYKIFAVWICPGCGILHIRDPARVYG